MKKDELLSLSHSLTERLRTIDYTALPISEYNKKYIASLYPALDYYMEIYADCILQGIRMVKLKPAEITLIDYGGGSGFLSMLAKKAGIGKVIYIDLNPLSVETAGVLKRETGTGADIILSGNSGTLADWCMASRTKPHLLVATDLIEHIYSLPDFFADLYKVNDSMPLLFTTASTPYNPFVKYRLRKVMKGCETGGVASPNYYTKRKQFIQKCYPSFPEERVNVWASLTRGLIFDDIRKAVESNRLPFPADKYNTCDPETGNWTERILPIKYYRRMTRTYGYELAVGRGYYNSHRNHFITAGIARCFNLFIRWSGCLGLFSAPFIFLTFKPRHMSRRYAE